ncbi:MAG: flagellar motor switch protein FliM [Christensenellaceae bacterium]
MAKVLSQKEIDDLLNALDSGEDVAVSDDENADDGYKIYDFKTANKFHKDQMRTLGVIFDSFAYLLASKLTGMLHTVCEIEVLSVEEQSFGELNNSLPDPVILGVMEMEPLQGSQLMELSATFVYGLIGRLFGGQADNSFSDKAFTEIELSIAENILQHMMDILRESWEKIVKVDPILMRIETSSQFTQIAEMNEPSAIVTLSVKLDNTEGLISMCIPHYSLQPIAKKLSTVNWTLAENMRGVQESKGKIIEKRLVGTNAAIAAVFNETTAPLREIINMQPGDIILINHNIRDYISVKVEDVPKFKGVIGTENNKYAVQIAEIVKENENIE